MDPPRGWRRAPRHEPFVTPQSIAPSGSTTSILSKLKKTFSRSSLKSAIPVSKSKRSVSSPLPGSRLGQVLENPTPRSVTNLTSTLRERFRASFIKPTVHNASTYSLASSHSTTINSLHSRQVLSDHSLASSESTIVVSANAQTQRKVSGKSFIDRAAAAVTPLNSELSEFKPTNAKLVRARPSAHQDGQNSSSTVPSSRNGKVELDDTTVNALEDMETPTQTTRSKCDERSTSDKQSFPGLRSSQFLTPYQLSTPDSFRCEAILHASPKSNTRNYYHDESTTPTKIPHENDMDCYTHPSVKRVKIRSISGPYRRIHIKTSNNEDAEQPSACPSTESIEALEARQRTPSLAAQTEDHNEEQITPLREYLARVGIDWDEYQKLRIERKAEVEQEPDKVELCQQKRHISWSTNAPAMTSKDKPSTAYPTTASRLPRSATQPKLSLWPQPMQMSAPAPSHDNKEFNLPKQPIASATTRRHSKLEPYIHSKQGGASNVFPKTPMPYKSNISTSVSTSKLPRPPSSLPRSAETCNIAASTLPPKKKTTDQKVLPKKRGQTRPPVSIGKFQVENENCKSQKTLARPVPLPTYLPVPTLTQERYANQGGKRYYSQAVGVGDGPPNLVARPKAQTLPRASTTNDLQKSSSTDDLLFNRHQAYMFWLGRYNSRKDKIMTACFEIALNRLSNPDFERPETLQTQVRRNSAFLQRITNLKSSMLLMRASLSQPNIDFGPGNAANRASPSTPIFDSPGSADGLSSESSSNSLDAEQTPSKAFRKAPASKDWKDSARAVMDVDGDVDDDKLQKEVMASIAVECSTPREKASFRIFQMSYPHGPNGPPRRGRLSFGRRVPKM